LVFWSFFPLYAMTTAAVVVRTAILCGHFGHLEVVPVVLMLNIVVQPFCILLLRHYRRVVPNKSPEPTAVGAVSSAIAVHAASRRWLSFFR
jgi:hypothetical protein